MKALALLSLAGLAAGSPLQSDRLVVKKTVEGRGTTVTASDMSNLRFYAEYSGAAYCNSDSAVGSQVTCSNNVCPTVTSDKAVILATLDGDTSSNIEGFIAADPARSLIVVSFRGSASIRNWLTNILFAQTPCTDLTAGCQVHTGFQMAWATVQAKVLATVAAARTANPTYGLVVTGHSLGGAVGTLAAAHLRKAGYPCDLYTYGSPRVGNDALASFVTAQAGAEYRVTHLDDPVPRLPPILLNYRHTSPEYWLYDKTATSTDYGPQDVRVCEGTANTQCDASTSGLDVDAHLYYFEHISGCGDGGIEFRRDLDGRGKEGDEELAQRLSMYAELDRGYANALGNDGK